MIGIRKREPLARGGGRAACSLLVVLVLLAMAGCDDKRKANAETNAAAADLANRVMAAAEQDIRQGSQAPDGVRFRGVTVWPQAADHHFAVCGLVRPFPDATDLYVPFVSIVDVTQPPGSDTPRFTFDQRVASTTSAATRVYVALTGYCYAGGGPTPGPMRSPMPLPPLPETVPDPRGGHVDTTPNPGPPPVAQPPVSPPAIARPPSPAAPVTSAAPDEAPASGSAVMRQNGNLHAGPHGEVVRVVPQGTPLRVFAAAPGGWFQVGDTAPWGWVHESMLDRH